MPNAEITEDDLSTLTEADIAAFDKRDRWLGKESRPKQIPPTGDWTQLIWKAGRGFGKTRSITEWLWWEGWRTAQPMILHAVAPTLSDVKGTMMKGPSGFQAVVPPECLWRGSWEQAYVETPQPILRLACSTIIKGFGAQEHGGRLRGPQCHALGADEIREFDRPAGNLEFVHSNMMFGVRLPWPDGSLARAVLATTPKAIPYLKSLYKQPGVRVITGTTYENLSNLSKSFKDIILAKEGTKIGRVEIHAEDLDGDEDGIFKKSWIRLWPPFKKLPEFTFILQSMDTAFEEENSIEVKKGKDPDYSACSTLGIFNTAQCFTEEERRKLRIKSKYAALLCDFWMERYAYPELLEAARKSYRTKWGQPGRQADVVLIEKKASGISLRQSLMTYGVPTWPFDPHNQSKTMRAHAVSPLVLQGMLFMPESTREDRKGEVRDWAEPLMDQMTMFAGEGTIEFDDGLDTCVGPETIVFTKTGLKRIDEIAPGEFVMTHKGRWRAVTSITARKASNYYRLKAKGLDELRLTGDHKVLTMRIDAPATAAKKAGVVEWARSDSLTPRRTYSFLRNGNLVRSLKRTSHDAAVLPRWANTFSRTVIDVAEYWPKGAWVTKTKVKLPRGRSEAVARYIPLNRETGWVLGLFAAEGCVHRSRARNGSSAKISWACDHLALERVAAWCERTLGRKAKVRVGDHCWQLSLGSTVVAPLFEEFGKYAMGKRLPPWVYEGPRAFVEGLIDGIVCGDGCVVPRARIVSRNQTMITSTSLSLLWGLKLLLAKLGRYSSVCVTKPSGVRKIFGRNSICNTAYGLSFADGNTEWTAVNTANYHGLYVERLERVDEELVVYDISVDEDKSFVTTGGTLHNCTQGLLYLQQKGFFHAEPQGRAFPDADEKEEMEHRQAREQARQEKRGKGNPYDQ